MIEYQEYTKLNNYNKQDKILSKLAVRYPNRFSDSLPPFQKRPVNDLQSCFVN